MKQESGNEKAKVLKAHLGICMKCGDWCELDENNKCCECRKQKTIYISLMIKVIMSYELEALKIAKKAKANYLKNSSLKHRLKNKTYLKDLDTRLNLEK